ncbi:bZIP transcription factor 44-like [Impatiens glandulifera]|uniref:bZIP transcription factor 44-like n=1 Tax=Impatiens glandulifera TaxID=253017 RepID=UPI001FB13160|nr:bZIP transcription factor 44-like [Impatiens glandulifera]
MASGNSSGSFPNPITEEKKRKRMQSNRESARRSRMRKQKHLDEMMMKVNQMRRDNNQILNRISFMTQHFLRVESDNSILRAQISELTHQLNSLNSIIGAAAGVVVGDNGFLNVDSWSNMGMMCFNQPIMASPDLFY